MDVASTALISKALDGLYERYLFTAQNIANANSPDYRPVTVSFEDSLRAAAGQGLAALQRETPSVHVAPPSSDGASGVRLDLELASASQTSMRYQALVDILGQELAVERAALTEGGR